MKIIPFKKKDNQPNLGLGIDWHFYISAYALVISFLWGIILILATVQDAIRERRFFFVPGVVLLGIAFFNLVEQQG